MMKCKGLKVYVENIDCYLLASLDGCLQKWIDDHQDCEIVDFREIKNRLIIFYREIEVPQIPLDVMMDTNTKLSERGWA